MRIAVVGSNMVDLTAYITRMPAPGETLEAPDFALGCGGKGANQAVAAALCGADVMMVSRVGTDIFADNTIRNFKAYGVDTTHVKKVEGMSSGVAPIFVDQHGQNSILIIKGANNALTPAEVDAAEADIRSCGLIILQLEIPRDGLSYDRARAAQWNSGTVEPGTCDQGACYRPRVCLRFLRAE